MHVFVLSVMLCFWPSGWCLETPVGPGDYEWEKRSVRVLAVKGCDLNSNRVDPQCRDVEGDGGSPGADVMSPDTDVAIPGGDEEGNGGSPGADVGSGADVSSRGADVSASADAAGSAAGVERDDGSPDADVASPVSDVGGPGADVGSPSEDEASHGADVPDRDRPAHRRAREYLALTESMFAHAYGAYITHAFPADELMPLSCRCACSAPPPPLRAHVFNRMRACVCAHLPLCVRAHEAKAALEQRARHPWRVRTDCVRLSRHARRAWQHNRVRTARPVLGPARAHTRILPLTLTRTLTHTLSRSLAHSLTHSLTHTHTHTHSLTLTHSDTLTYARTHASTHTHRHKHTNIRQTCACAHVRAYTQAHTHKHTPTHTHTHMYARAHTLTHEPAHAHAHTQVGARQCKFRS
jgi:hypothetical protein